MDSLITFYCRRLNIFVKVYIQICPCLTSDITSCDPTSNLTSCLTSDPPRSPQLPWHPTVHTLDTICLQDNITTYYVAKMDILHSDLCAEASLGTKYLACLRIINNGYQQTSRVKKKDQIIQTRAVTNNKRSLYYILIL